MRINKIIKEDFKVAYRDKENDNVEACISFEEEIITFTILKEDSRPDYDHHRNNACAIRVRNGLEIFCSNQLCWSPPNAHIAQAYCDYLAEKELLR